MKIVELFKGLWEKKEVIRNVSNIIIRVIDAIDGVKDWELKDDRKKDTRY